MRLTTYSQICEEWCVRPSPFRAMDIHFLKGEENLGMAMTFTLATQLREQLSALIRSRAEQREREEMEKERRAIEACLSMTSVFSKSHSWLPGRGGSYSWNTCDS